jgi:hypothetical protein
VATVLAGLRELRMSLSARLRSLALGLPQLTDLQLNNCGDLQQLVLRCPCLERLSLQVGGPAVLSGGWGWLAVGNMDWEVSENWRLSPVAAACLACVLVLAGLGKMPAGAAPTLEATSMTGTPRPVPFLAVHSCLQACRAVRGPALVEAVSHCPALRELDLQYCPVRAALQPTQHARMCVCSCCLHVCMHAPPWLAPAVWLTGAVLHCTKVTVCVKCMPAPNAAAGAASDAGGCGGAARGLPLAANGVGDGATGRLFVTRVAAP